MKVLVTGASGFIGSILVEKLLESGFDVTASIRSTSSKEYLRDNRIRFIELDYSDIQSLKEVFYIQKFECILHLAGLTKARAPEDFNRVNYLYTKNLIDSIKDLNIRLIFLSSFAAHGPGDEKEFLKVRNLDKDNPNTQYGISKLKAENYIRDNLKENYLIFRPTGVYGHREKDYYIYFKTIKNHLEPYLGYQPQRLSFVYVDDLVELCIKAITSSKSNNTYFVSDGNMYLDTEFAEITKRVLNTWTIKLRFPLFVVKWISNFNEFFGIISGKSFTLNKDKYNILSARNWDCDIEDLKKDLDYNPKVFLEEGVRKTIEWYKNHGWL